MEWDDKRLLPADLPFVFTDGSDVFKNIAKTHKQHTQGFFILGPSGIGKTHFIKRQPEADWIDGDIIWYETNALPYGKWWESPLEEINRVEARCDVITMEAKRCGFWIIGASNYWLKPDAIVIPDWETHKQYIQAREQNNYDGGATSDDLEQVQKHIEVILKWKDKGVPCFNSVDEAATFLANSIKN